MKKVLLSLVALGLLSGAGVIDAKAADNWPAKEIRMYVGFTAGGAVDLMARSVQAKLSEKLGVPVIVENYPGGKGRIVHNKFLTADREGYTIFIQSQANLTLTMATDENKYKLEDIAFINANWIDPNIVVARKALGWKSFADMVEAARKEPGKYSIGYAAAASFLCEIMEKENIPLKYIPYSNGNEARMALMGNHIDMSAGGADGFLPVRDISDALCTFWTEPNQLYPEGNLVADVNAKLGMKLPVNAVIRFFAVHNDVRKNYPERFAKLVKAFKDVSDDPEFQAFCDKTRIGRSWYGPDQTFEKVKVDVDYWLPIIKESLKKAKK